MELRGARAGTRPPRGPCTATSTPDKIPDFFIPPKLPAGPAEPERRPSWGLLGTSEQNLASAAPSRPRSPRSEAGRREQEPTEVATRHVIQIESAEDWLADETATNADPQAQGAACPSVPKAQTPYGFATLAEPTRGARSPCSTANTELWPRWAPRHPAPPRGVKANGGDGAPREAGGNSHEPRPPRPAGWESLRAGVLGRVLTLRPPFSRSVSLLKGFASGQLWGQGELKPGHSVGRHGSVG